MTSQTVAFKRSRIIQMIVLSASVGLIYQLPYLRYSFYDSMLAAFNVNHVQLGNFMSAFGLGSFICYLIGGVLADRYSSKKLLSVGQILTGLAGFYFATFPSYPIAIGISLFWAFSTSLIFWPALIRYIRNMGDDSEQGRLYGSLEGVRGLISTLVGLGMVAVFNALGAATLGLKTVIISYACINILLGIVTWFIIPADENKTQIKERTLGEDISKVFKMPQAWILTIIIFVTMTTFICLGYLTPYLTGIMGASVTFAAAIGMLRTWGLQILGGPIGGLTADKIQSTSKTMMFNFGIIIIGFFIMLIIPGKQTFLIAATIAMFAFGFAIYSNRGIYFASISETKVPMELTGAVIGFASAVGFLPDAFMYTVIGYWLDKYPGIQGYNYIFICAIVCGIIGFIASYIMKNLAKKQKPIPQD